MDYKLTILLPTLDETDSLEETVKILIDQNLNDIFEILIIISDEKTTKESKEIANKLKNKYNLINIVKQKKKLLGGALQDGFESSCGSHLLLMASDRETEPNDVKNFIIYSKQNLDSIITGNRWLKGGGFKSYSIIKFLLNLMFQKFFSLLFSTKLSDLTYGFRVFPIEVVRKIKWEELNHSFLFETLIKPIKIGVNIIEIPCTWKKRSSGISSFNFSYYFDYFKVGFKTLLKSKNSLIKN